jgi:hypothetical protein
MMRLNHFEHLILRRGGAGFRATGGGRWQEEPKTCFSRVPNIRVSPDSDHEVDQLPSVNAFS